MERIKDSRIPYTLDKLKEVLDFYCIDTSTWGVGTTKTIAQLCIELSDGESELVEIQGQNIIRKCTVADVDIFYNDPTSGLYLLKESKQEFSNGTIRERNLTASIAEKMYEYETPEQAVYRGLLEELGIFHIKELHQLRIDSEITESRSYPSLLTMYTIHHYVALLHSVDFNPTGYEEHQKDKSNYYTWQKVA